MSLLFLQTCLLYPHQMQTMLKKKRVGGQPVMKRLYALDDEKDVRLIFQSCLYHTITVPRKFLPLYSIRFMGLIKSSLVGLPTVYKRCFGNFWSKFDSQPRWLIGFGKGYWKKKSTNLDQMQLKILSHYLHKILFNFPCIPEIWQN